MRVSATRLMVMAVVVHELEHLFVSVPYRMPAMQISRMPTEPMLTTMLLVLLSLLLWAETAAQAPKGSQDPPETNRTA